MLLRFYRGSLDTEGRGTVVRKAYGYRQRSERATAFQRIDTGFVRVGCGIHRYEASYGSRRCGEGRLYTLTSGMASRDRSIVCRTMYNRTAGARVLTVDTNDIATPDRRNSRSSLHQDMLSIPPPKHTPPYTQPYSPHNPHTQPIPQPLLAQTSHPPRHDGRGEVAGVLEAVLHGGFAARDAGFEARAGHARAEAQRERGVVRSRGCCVVVV